MHSDRLAWRKSKRSQQGADCVEVAALPNGVAVRDSKNPDGPMLTFRTPAFAALLESIRSV